MRKETLADIGEFGLIRRIRHLVQKEGAKTPGVTVGIGDDAAAIHLPRDRELLVTCDCLVEGRHFLLEHTSPLNLGRRAMVANISDIGSMGGCPLYALVSLGLKPEMLVRDVEELYKGFQKELNRFPASIIGGNITKVQDFLFIDISLFGEAESGKLLLRSSAEPGDTILVTGYPGQAAAGLKLILKSKEKLNLTSHPLVQAYTLPTHRAREGKALAQTGLARAVIDTSDGFLGDLGHICEESGVGASLIAESLPLSDDLRRAAQELDLDPIDLFLHESDDYELIITCAPESVPKVREAIATVSRVPLTEVGRITESKGNIKIFLPDGKTSQLVPSGWDHFKQQG